MRLTIDIILYCLLVFGLMMTLLLVPTTGEKMLVIMGPNTTPSSIYAVLAGTDGRVVEQLSTRRYVIQSNDNGFVRKLYTNGAFLVMNASANYGCAQPEV